MSAIIQFINVSKRYQLGLTRASLPSLISDWANQYFKKTPRKSQQASSIWALQNVNFELENGQSLALIGPNGVGKTTILKLLSNITRPTSGHIITKGKISALIELGAGFHPDLTGRENIFLNGTILGLKRKDIENRFDEIVSFSEIEPFLDTPLKRYSSGMAVRLGFSVAAFIDPEILLVDEVLAVGDAAFRQKCINRIRELLANGTSIIFVSHNTELVRSVCDEAIFLNKGRIIKHDKTGIVIDAYNRYLHEQRAKRLRLSSPENADIAQGVEITKVEIKNLEGKIRNLRNYLAAEIQIHYLAFKDLGDANMVIRILRSDGVSCCVMHTFIDNSKFQVTKGTGVVSLLLDPLQLYEGEHIIRATFKNSDDTIGLATGWSNWFMVRGPGLGRILYDGVFEPRRKWKHQQQTFQPSITVLSEREDEEDWIDP